MRDPWRLGVRLLALVVLLLGPAGSGCSREPVGSPEEPVASAAAASRPSVVLLISLDTLRPDHLGAYGYERFTSPTLDALAAEGVVFEDVTATASWTLPSHASMLTGLTPRSHGVVSSRTVLHDQVPTLPRILAAAGWQTGAVVNVEWLKRENYRLTRDFELYSWAPSTLDRRSPSTWVTDQAIEWMSERDERPLFLFVHYYDVHSDYVSEPAYEKLFVGPYEGPVDGTGWQLKQASLPDAYVRFCVESFDPERCKFSDDFVVDANVERIAFGAEDLRHLEALYDAQIRQLDAELGRLFVALRRLGVADETLLIVTSDHGEEFLEHGRLEHFLTAYQESVRVPLILRGPGIPAGTRVETPVSGVDVAATILAAAGVSAPNAIEGLDLAPLWSGGDTTAFEGRPIYVEAAGGVSNNYIAGDFYPIYRAVRKGRFKLIVEGEMERTWLYDLAEDPGEKVDVSGSHPEVVAELRAIAAARYSGSAAEASEPVQLSPEDLERLRALGYVP